jgi:hypothetical protein
MASLLLAGSAMSSRSLRPGELRSVDRRARRLIRAVEPDLRAHLEPALLDSGVVAELYIRLRDLLAAHDPDAAATGSRRDLAEELALTLYLVVSTRQPGGEVEPDLLVSLRESLLAALGREGERRADQPPHETPES